MSIRFLAPMACMLMFSTHCSAQSPLNVVMILVDDLGWSDLGCYGSDYYETPNVDAFAKTGLKFELAYAAAPVCSPTRAALLTGKHPARLDMTIWHEGAVSGGPKNRRLLEAKANANLPLEERTLAEVFRDAGYTTAHIGKWHLGTAAHYPETQGFDLNVGGTFWGAPSTFFHPFSGPWRAGNPEIRYVPGLGLGKPGQYLPDRLTDIAIDFMEENTERPFFLNLWYHTVHSPIEAPKALVDQFAAKTKGAIHTDETYAAMVHQMDANVGRLLQHIAQLGLAENTLVIFTSDNGGVDFDQRGIVPTSNAPLRSGKGTLYEGGLRVPLIIRAPDAAVGTSAQPALSQDLYSTIMNTALGEDRHEPFPSDGMDLSELLQDAGGVIPQRDLFWHFPHYYYRMTPASAVRSGDWKLIHYYEDDRMELYDLARDPREEHDLAETAVAKRRELRAKLDEWRNTVGANAPTVREAD